MADNPVKLIYFCIKTTKITNFVSSKLIKRSLWDINTKFLLP